MTVSATARIAQRIDTSPTERIPQVLPPLPPAVTGALDWAGVDIKPTAAMPPCPVWCTGVNDQHDTDGSIVHFSVPRVVTVAEVGTQRTQEIQVDLCRIDDPGRGVGETVIGLDAEQCALNPRHALQLAEVLADLAAQVLGVPHGYAAGLGDGTGVCERAIVEAAHPVRTFVARLAARFRRGAR